jgi:hypothetical protein
MVMDETGTMRRSASGAARPRETILRSKNKK